MYSFEVSTAPAYGLTLFRCCRRAGYGPTLTYGTGTHARHWYNRLAYHAVSGQWPVSGKFSKRRTMINKTSINSACVNAWASSAPNHLQLGTQLTTDMMDIMMFSENNLIHRAFKCAGYMPLNQCGYFITRMHIYNRHMVINGDNY